MMNPGVEAFLKSLQNYLVDLEAEWQVGNPGASSKQERAFRYFLEDRLGRCAPELVQADLVPLSHAAAERVREHLAAGGTKKWWLLKKKLGIVYEHAVPLRVLFKLLDSAKADPEEMWRLLQGFYRVVWITCEEDLALRQAGLVSKMPSGWEPGRGPEARHRAVGISWEQL